MKFWGLHNILQGWANKPFSTTKKSIQQHPRVRPRWILVHFKLKFCWKKLFSLICDQYCIVKKLWDHYWRHYRSHSKLAMTSIIERNNLVWSLLKPLLKKVTLIGSRMLCYTHGELIHTLIPFQDGWGNVNKNLPLFFSLLLRNWLSLQ
jgi:hypothetical protein